MSLFISASCLAVAVITYGYKSKRIALLCFALYLLWGLDHAWAVMHAGSPATFWAIAAVGAGLPLALLGIVAADARFGLFSLDTFFGIIFVVALAPVLLVANAVATLWGALSS